MLICSMVFRLLLSHMLGTEKIDRNTRAKARMIIGNAQLLSVSGYQLSVSCKSIGLDKHVTESQK